MPDEPSRGMPTGWKPASEEDHSTVCATCGERYDMRKLDKVLEHNHGAAIEMVETFGPPTRRQ